METESAMARFFLCLLLNKHAVDNKNMRESDRSQKREEQRIKQIGILKKHIKCGDTNNRKKPIQRCRFAVTNKIRLRKRTIYIFDLINNRGYTMPKNKVNGKTPNQTRGFKNYCKD